MKTLLLPALAAAAVCSASAENPCVVDLPAVLKLAGANHDEIELARSRQAEAIATSVQAWQRFWPGITIGSAWRGHEGNIQDVAGAILDINKRQYTVGGAVLLDWAPGDFYYGALAAEQRAIAAGELTEKARLDLIQRAVVNYYDLLRAEAVIAVMTEELRLLGDYASQLSGAVEAGTAFRADLLRVQAQTSRDRLRLRQAEEERDRGAAILAETLRLAPDCALRPAKADLVPVTLTEPRDVSSLVAEAGDHRPELHAAGAVIQAAVLERKRSRVAPWIPNVQAGYAGGGLGGGKADHLDHFDGQQDFVVTMGWKIGPGGLFDRQAQAIASAREQAALSQAARVRAEIGREVVDAAVRVESARDQIAINTEAVAASEAMVRLARERQASQIGVVLEYLLAQEELTRARQSQIEAITGFNKAQHALLRAVGKAATLRD